MQYNKVSLSGYGFVQRLDSEKWLLKRKLDLERDGVREFSKITGPVLAFTCKIRVFAIWLVVLIPVVKDWLQTSD